MVLLPPALNCGDRVFCHSAHTHTHTCTHTRTHARTDARTHARTHSPTHTHTHTPTHPRTHARTHARTQARRHAGTQARTHTHTHTSLIPLAKGTLASVRQKRRWVCSSGSMIIRAISTRPSHIQNLHLDSGAHNDIREGLQVEGPAVCPLFVDKPSVGLEREPKENMSFRLSVVNNLDWRFGGWGPPNRL